MARWRSCFMTSIGRSAWLPEPDDDDDGRHDDAIDDEDRQRPRPQVAEHEADRDHPGHERGEHPGEEWAGADVDARLPGDELADLEDGRTSRDRRRHQE